MVLILAKSCCPRSVVKLVIAYTVIWLRHDCNHCSRGDTISYTRYYSRNTQYECYHGIISECYTAHILYHLQHYSHIDKKCKFFMPLYLMHLLKQPPLEFKYVIWC